MPFFFRRPRRSARRRVFSIGRCSHAPHTRPPNPHSTHLQFPLLVPADGSAPITGGAAILAALGGAGAAPADGAAAEQWAALAEKLAGPAASLVEPLAGERAGKPGEADAALADLKR